MSSVRTQPNFGNALLERASFLASEPKTWLIIGIFLNITGITDFFPALAQFETLIFLAGCATAFCRLWFATAQERSWLPVVGIAGSAILCSGIVSSFYNQQDLFLFFHLGWRHFAKFILLTMLCLMVYPRGNGVSGQLKATIYWSMVVLAASVLFRYFYLDQTNPDTGRMALLGRHGDPNFVCLYMTIGVILGFERMTKTTSIKNLFSGCLVLVLLCVTSWFTESRAGLSLLCLTIVCSVFSLPLPVKKRTILSIMALVAGIIVGLFGDRLVNRYRSIDDESNSGRVAGIEAALDMFETEPLLGSGFTSSARFVKAHHDIDFVSDTVPLEIHTTPLQILGELGILGLFCYGILYGMIIRRAFKQDPSSTDRKVALLISFAIIGNMVSIPMTYIGTVHGIGLIILHGLYADQT